MTTPSFSTIMEELKRITRLLEDESTTLDDGLQLVEQAAPLIAQAKSRLESTRHQFHELTADFDEETQHS